MNIRYPIYEGVYRILTNYLGKSRLPDPAIIHHSIRNCMYTYSDSPSLWGTEQSAGIRVGRRNRRTA